MEGDRTVPPGSATILRLTGMGLRAHQLLQCKEAAALLQTILPQYPNFCYDMPTASSFASLSSFLVSLFLKSRYMLNGKKKQQLPTALLPSITSHPHPSSSCRESGSAAVPSLSPLLYILMIK